MCVCDGVALVATVGREGDQGDYRGVGGCVVYQGVGGRGTYFFSPHTVNSRKNCEVLRVTT